ncbi:MAG: SIMPL domain-containing protein [Planctomycetia bacterium]
MTTPRLPLASVALLVPTLAHAQSSRGLHLEPAVPTIAVSGAAEIRVVPDEVLLRFSVEGREAKLDAAVKACDTSTAAVLAFVKESGIAAQDLQSDFIAIAPVYERPNGEESPVPRYFRASRGFAVRLRDVAKFDALLEGILEAGADRVEDVAFRTTALRKHRDLARQQAIRAAREKAVALAGELGAKVGKPFSIEETSGGGVRNGSSTPRERWATAQNISQDAGPGGAAAEGETEPKLAAGMISVTSRVDVVFTLE